MKRLLLSLLFLAGLNAHSQDYIPMLNDNSWYVNFYAFLAPADDNQWVSPVGDVTFNDTIYTHYQESYSLNPNMPQEQNDYYIREDIDEKRVYTRIYGQEQLLYDFSLEVGDEVSTLVDGEWLYTFAVVAKDSFAVDSGRKRVRLFLEDTSEWGSPVWEEWIEGIGSRDHPLKNFELLMPDANYQVLCNHYGDEIPYSVSQFNGEPFTCPGSEVDDDYIPLLNETSWHVAISGIGFNAVLNPVAVGDAVFEGTTYMDYQENFTDPNGLPYENHYYIREDIDAKRVYQYNYDHEDLLYDFSLNVGDDVTINVWEEPYEFTVISKDSFAVPLGRQRVRLTLQHGDENFGFTETWVEGIGNFNHPLVGMNIVVPDPTYTLLCQNYDGTIPYSVNSYDGQPYTCPGSEVEPEPADDYIPLINNNAFYIHRADFGYDDTHWTLPVGISNIDDMEYTHYKESFEGSNGTVENDYYIREDTAAKRVYKRSGEEEYLLYDFSLQVGDNVTLYPDGDPMEFTVVAKDSFAVNVGRQRVRLFLEYTGGDDEGQEVWIEGLGNLHHPMTGFHDYIQDPVFTLLCNNYNGETPYTVAEFMSEPFTCPEVGERHDEGLSVTEYAFQDISIYPNPFLESFVIITQQPLYNATLSLHDVLGRVISETVVNGSEIEVTRANLPKGIYLLRIVQDGKPAITKKIIAE